MKKSLGPTKLAFLCVSLFGDTAPCTASPQTLMPGTVWRDTTGNVMQAHGGGFIQAGKTFYWFGEDHANGAAYKDIPCYSSTDLAHWTFQGYALTQQPTGDLGPHRVVERPKVLYNRHTKQYVMYLHIDSSDYSEAKLGVATSKRVTGPYAYLGSFNPMGHQSRDMTLYQDTDGTAYVAFEDRGDGGGLRIEQLAPDYLTVARDVAVVGGRGTRESPAIIKISGVYFLLGSRLNGWEASDNDYVTAPSLAGPWSAYQGLAEPGTKTYNSQTAFVLPVQGKKTTSYLYIGDRWTPNDLGDSRYVWMPLTIQGQTLSLPPDKPWTIDTDTGETTGPLSGISAAARAQRMNITQANGLALTPPMGFNTWNTFKMNPTETVIKEITAALVSKGFQAAGYQYVNIDEGWDKGRASDGQMIVDTAKFPQGLKAAADYIHSQGLRAGIYTELGPDRPGYLGSEGHYDQDMKTFASWGFDYIKVDVNHVSDRSEANLRRLFSEMSAAVKNCGRPMVFSLCNQGDGNYAGWASALGNSWRVGKDIDYISWVEPYQKTQWEGVLYELDRSMAHPEIAGPGAWNDADMMLVGVHSEKLTPLTTEEAKSHVSLWCAINSPLIIGADVRQLSPEDTMLLTNKEAIAVSQDPYGQQAHLVFSSDGLQVYSKILEAAHSGKRGVVLFNRSSAPGKIAVTAAMLGLSGEFAVRDLWAHQDLGRWSAYTVTVPPHGTVMLKTTSSG